MKRAALAVSLLTLLSILYIAPESNAARFSFGLPRDSACLDAYYPAPCVFPPVCNPCAVPCRPPCLQPQAVPCAFKTACPSRRLPCHGVSYGKRPYHLFR